MSKKNRKYVWETIAQELRTHIAGYTVVGVGAKGKPLKTVLGTVCSWQGKNAKAPIWQSAVGEEVIEGLANLAEARRKVEDRLDWD